VPGYPTPIDPTFDSPPWHQIDVIAELGAEMYGIEVQQAAIDWTGSLDRDGQDE